MRPLLKRVSIYRSLPNIRKQRALMQKPVPRLSHGGRPWRPKGVAALSQSSDSEDFDEEDARRIARSGIHTLRAELARHSLGTAGNMDALVDRLGRFYRARAVKAAGSVAKAKKEAEIFENEYGPVFDDAYFPESGFGWSRSTNPMRKIPDDDDTWPDSGKYASSRTCFLSLLRPGEYHAALAYNSLVGVYDDELTELVIRGGGNTRAFTFTSLQADERLESTSIIGEGRVLTPRRTDEQVYIELSTTSTCFGCRVDEQFCRADEESDPHGEFSCSRFLSCRELLGGEKIFTQEGGDTKLFTTQQGDIELCVESYGMGSDEAYLLRFSPQAAEQPGSKSQEAAAETLLLAPGAAGSSSAQVEVKTETVTYTEEPFITHTSDTNGKMAAGPSAVAVKQEEKRLQEHEQDQAAGVLQRKRIKLEAAVQRKREGEEGIQVTESIDLTDESLPRHMPANWDCMDPGARQAWVYDWHHAAVNRGDRLCPACFTKQGVKYILKLLRNGRAQFTCNSITCSSCYAEYCLNCGGEKGGGRGSGYHTECGRQPSWLKELEGTPNLAESDPRVKQPPPQLKRVAEAAAEE